MATRANAIFVPRPAANAYNPDRPAGKLLQSQTLHLREALVQHLRKVAEVLAIDPRALKTEGEVSEYIHKATAILHTHAAHPSRK